MLLKVPRGHLDYRVDHGSEYDNANYCHSIPLMAGRTEVFTHTNIYCVYGTI